MNTENRYCSNCKESTEQELVKLQPSRILSPVAWACRTCKEVVDIVKETQSERQRRVEKEKANAN